MNVSDLFRFAFQSLTQLNLPEKLQQLLTKALATSDDSPSATLMNPKLVTSGNLTVVGIFRESTDEEIRTLNAYFGRHANAMIPVEVARTFARQTPGFDKTGYHHVLIRVDEERHVRLVVEYLRSHKHSFHSLVEFVEHLQHQYGLMLWSMTALGTVAC